MSKKKVLTLTLDSSLESLASRKSKTVQQLAEVGITSLEDLLSIIPLRIDKLPPPSPFSTLQEGELFQGIGKILNIQKRPNFYRKGKGKSLLYNVQVYIEDILEPGNTLKLQFFNVYRSVLTKMEQLTCIIFQGRVQQFNGSLQITNPIFNEYNREEQNNTSTTVQVIPTYPTVNGIKPTFLKKLFEKIPLSFWQTISEILPDSILQKRHLLPLGQTYQLLHGHITEFTNTMLEQAKRRLIYADFFNEQLKIFVRRSLVKQQKCLPIKISTPTFHSFINIFPYELTEGQFHACMCIKQDLEQDFPIMKLIQGDVGSGKTTVALIAALMVIHAGKQVAFMCPTETLAQQHFHTISNLISPLNIKVELLVGGDKEKIKQTKRDLLANGMCKLVIGTHTLIQDSITFQNLGLAIIDEQHKFGVNQRIKLTQKGSAVHTLIMTATPIPRSLCLTQYGDLDIVVINSIPQTRKKIQTRIVTPQTFEKFLSFVATRLAKQEQVYVVVPAIHENEDSSYISLEKSFNRFAKFFPNYTIAALHGELSAEEKNHTLQAFANKQIDILIATSVIEVGIDVPNATIMTILSPDRFGLSSLHQLRGRVGRGDKPGFCFLITDKHTSKDSMERLKIIESSTDGFYISEEDLKMRGEGTLFGTEQSGSDCKRLGNIFSHPDLMEYARADLYEQIAQENPKILNKISQLQNNEHIIKTI